MFRSAHGRIEIHEIRLAPAILTGEGCKFGTLVIFVFKFGHDFNLSCCWVSDDLTPGWSTVLSQCARMVLEEGIVRSLVYLFIKPVVSSFFSSFQQMSHWRDAGGRLSKGVGTFPLKCCQYSLCQDMILKLFYAIQPVRL